MIAMVGLPARGKSYISKAIVRYLNFIGCPARLFNAGNKRRQEGAAGVQAGFFDASNLDAAAQRERMAMETLDELLEWIRSVTTPEAGCACGIFDATNTTIARREKVRQRLVSEEPPVKLVFLELVCNDEGILQENYRMKLSNDDYKGTDPEAALLDFMERVRQYERVYEQVDDTVDCRPLSASATPSRPQSASARVLPPPEQTNAFGSLSAIGRPGCVQMIDAGRKLIVTQCEGFILNELLSLLHCIHLGTKTIWITLVGETTNDLQGMLGGDSALSPDGLEYARAVREHIESRERSVELRDTAGRPPEPALVVTGTLRRNHQMADVLCADETELPELLTCRETSLGRNSSSSIGWSDRLSASDSKPPAAAPAKDGGGAEPLETTHAKRRRTALHLHRLNELCAGKLDSLTYEQMRSLYPTEYQARAKDKLAYRYPGAGGESYMDLILRLESIILTLEQSRRNVVVACDRAVCRVLLGYFNGLDELERLPYIDVHAGVVELRRSHSGFSSTHTPITSGRTTRAAGPGTAGFGAEQWSNRLSTGKLPLPRTP